MERTWNHPLHHIGFRIKTAPYVIRNEKKPLERDIALDKLRRNEHAIPLVTSPKASGPKINLSTSLKRMKNHIAVATDEGGGSSVSLQMQLLLKEVRLFVRKIQLLALQPPTWPKPCGPLA